MKRFLPIAAAVPLLMGQTDRTPLKAVTAIRHASLSDSSRITVEVSGPFDFHWDRLHEPERVYYDITGAEPKFDGKRSYTEEPVDRLVERIRAAETQPGVTRVVVQLSGPMEIAARKAANPDRLIIELKPSVSKPVAAPSATADAASKPPPRNPPAAASNTARVAAPPAARPDPGPATPAATPNASAPPVAPAVPVEIPKAAKRTTSGDNSLTRALGLKIQRVALDPGHGGHDEGTAGPHGLLEKELVLDVAQRLGEMIQDRMGSEVFYTRSDDTYVPLETRTAIANEKKADLFLSIHANSSSAPEVAGIESFYLELKGTKYSMDIATRENASVNKSVFDLENMVQQIARKDKADESRDFATQVQNALFSFSVKNIPGARDRGVKSAPFVVLIGAHMPSVLTEIGFLSNSREEALLRTSDYRQKLAEAIFKGVSKYADSLSHFQMSPSPVAKTGTADSGRDR